MKTPDTEHITSGDELPTDSVLIDVRFSEEHRKQVEFIVKTNNRLKGSKYFPVKFGYN